MGVLANFIWLPLTLMGIVLAQSNDTVICNDRSIKSSTLSTTSVAPDLVVSGDLSKAARVERMSSEMDATMVNDSVAAVQSAGDGAEASAGTDMNSDAVSTPKTTDGQYDVIDVMAATTAGMGKTKSGQTTRIYTTGDVNDDFWLKHLGDDFKHAIHLQVGGTNDEYNRIINQTTGGVHEEVHHEYLPGAERPQRDGYGQSNLNNQLKRDGEATAFKDNYLRQQGQQRYVQNGYPQQQHNTHNYNTNINNNNRFKGMHNTHTHAKAHSHTCPTQTHTRGSKSRYPVSNRNRFKPIQSSIISSSEDTLHAAQSQATPTSAASSSVPLRYVDTDNPLPFKSPFNDYGSRPTRDLTYLLYKRGL